MSAESKKILVTGGAGFIGSFICRNLLKRGYQPVIYDEYIQYISPLESQYHKHLAYRFRGIKDKCIFERGDTRHKLNLRDVISRHEPEAIIHMANMPLADLSFHHPEEAVSSILGGTVNILDALPEFSFVKRLVYASSSMVYGDFLEIPCPEDHPKKPKDIYGATKYAIETLIEAYGRRHGIKYNIVRPSAVYGPTDANRRVSQIFIENALRGETLELHGGGEAMLDFTYVEDIAQGLVLATITPDVENETFNITTGNGRSLLEYAEIVQKYIPGLDIKIMPHRGHRPKRGSLSIEKAGKLLGYKPQYSLETGIPIYIDYLRQIHEMPDPWPEDENGDE